MNALPTLIETCATITPTNAAVKMRMATMARERGLRLLSEVEAALPQWLAAGEADEPSAARIRDGVQRWRAMLTTSTCTTTVSRAQLLGREAMDAAYAILDGQLP